MGIITTALATAAAVAGAGAAISGAVTANKQAKDAKAANEQALAQQEQQAKEAREAEAAAISKEKMGIDERQDSAIQDISGFIKELSKTATDTAKNVLEIKNQGQPVQNLSIQDNQKELLTKVIPLIILAIAGFIIFKKAR